MRLAVTALATVLLTTPAIGYAHGHAPAPAHGGEMQDAHGNWIELVLNGRQVEVYVLDGHEAPVSSSQVSGAATVLLDGKPYKAQLVPADGNELTGTLPMPASARTAATVSLRIGGKPATARFTSL